MNEYAIQNAGYLTVKQPLLAHLSPAARLAVALSLVMIGVLLFSAIGILIAFTMFGINDFEHLNFSQHLDDPATISTLKLMQAFSATGGFILPPLLFAWLVAGNFAAYLKLNKLPDIKLVLLTLLLILSIGPLINFFAELNSRMHLPAFMADLEQWMRNSEDEAARITTAFLKMNGLADLFINLFIIAFLAAFGEELLFRGTIQRIFTEWIKNKHIAIWLTAVLFSAFHFQFYGFLPRMLLGALLGYLFQWSKSIWLPVLAHFINNAIAVIISYFIARGTVSKSIETVGSSTTDWIILIFSSIFLVFLLKYMHTISQKNIPLPAVES